MGKAGGGGGRGGKEEPEGPLVPSLMTVTATHRSKPNTDQYQFIAKQGTSYMEETGNGNVSSFSFWAIVSMQLNLSS